MGWESAIGSRLITSLVDYYAEQEQKKVWASVPKGDVVSDGFVDITYEQFANAVNHASWWLESQLGVSEGHFETFAYAGPKDLSYPILAVAASKAGRTVSVVYSDGSEKAECIANILDARFYCPRRSQLIKLRYTYSR